MPEKKFQQFRDTLTPEQFNDATFLEQHAKSIAVSDISLSNRILRRVKNLQNNKIKHINNIIKTNQETLECGSTKNSGHKTTQTASVANQKNHEVISYFEQKTDDENKQPTIENSNIGSTSQQKSKESTDLYQKAFKWVKEHYSFSLIIFSILAFSFYLLFVASPRYESRAQLIVEQPDAMATMDPSMALLTGLGVKSGTTDNELLKAYIYSNDMLDHLNNTLDLKSHYTNEEIDSISRLSKGATTEEFSEYYQQHISVITDETSSVITILAQGFDVAFSQSLVKEIVKRAEWYINSIGHQLAESQLQFIRNEHKTVEKRLEQSQIELLNFQQRYNLLDPMAEGVAFQQIAYSLEGEISKKEAELKALRKVMSDQSPQIKIASNTLKALKEQLKNERSKLSNEGDNSTPVSEILAKFTDYKVKMELALQAFTSSQISLEKSRIEAYRQLKYLVVVENPTLPEQNTYPRVVYNILLFSVIVIGLSLISKIILSVIRELR